MGTKRNIIDHHYLEASANYPVRLFTTKETSYILRISEKLIRRYIKEGLVDPIRPHNSREYFWTVTDMVELLQFYYPKLAVPLFLRGALNWAFLGAEPLQGMDYLKEFEEKRDEIYRVYRQDEIKKQMRQERKELKAVEAARKKIQENEAKLEETWNREAGRENPLHRGQQDPDGTGGVQSVQGRHHREHDENRLQGKAL